MTKMAVVTTKLLFERIKEGLWSDWFLPQLQVGGALHKRHMTELGSEHIDRYGVQPTEVRSLFCLFSSTDTFYTTRVPLNADLVLAD